MLTRDRYLSRLRPFYDVPDLVKLVTGVRRCGKTVLMSQAASEIERRVGPGHVIRLDFELMEYSMIKTAADLEQHVVTQLGRGLTYVFLDEVQTVPDFELAINSLRARGDVSIFVTGSNADLLSVELATRLAGRYVETRVWPLSYAESLALRNLDSTAALLADYLEWGGLPLRFALEPGGTTKAYLRDVFNSVVLRDVVQRLRIRDVPALDVIIDFALENLGRVLSPKSLTTYLKAQGRSVAVETVYTYLGAMASSLLFNRVRRYDVRGKAVMANLDKYYATDLGLLAAKTVGGGPGLGDMLENAVFVELSARGYEVHTGKTGTSEIDFVAIKDGQPRYVQVAYLLADKKVTDREFGAFSHIRDNYPCFVISADPFIHSQGGVDHLRIEDFLLAPPAALT